MRTVTWESDDGYMIQMGVAPPYLFKNLTDDLGATAETSRAPRQDGMTTHYVSLGHHIVNITGSMVAYGNKAVSAQRILDRLKSEICQAMTPNRMGYLTYHTEDGNKRVRCRPLAIPTFGIRYENTCTLDIEFVSDKHYWETSDLYVSVVGLLKKMWHFPWVTNRTAKGVFSPVGVIENPTGEVIYPVIEVTSTAQLITLANQTMGKHISISKPIGTGQKMVIGMEDMSAVIWTQNLAGVYVETEDVSYWLTLDSEPWGLVPGKNKIVIANEVPAETPITYIKYRLPYLGV